MRTCLFVVTFAVIAACTSSYQPPDLSGSVACGTMTCGDGQLCIDSTRDGSEGSSNEIETFSCATPPADCQLLECSYECPHEGVSNCCPPCIVGLCGGIPGYDGSRNVSCVGF